MNPDTVMRRARRRTVRWGLAVLGVTLVCAIGPVQSAQQRILIVNSEQSVPRYAVAHTSFKNALGRTTDEIDLGTAANTEATLRRLIETTNPAVVYCIGSQAFVSTTNVAKDRNIIVSSAINVGRFPATPKVFGIASELRPAAQMTHFRLLFPQVRRIGILYSADYNDAFVRDAEAQDSDVGLQVVARQLRR